MPELKLGAKYECFNCGTKFYDLGKAEPLRPKCGANQKDATPETPAVSQASRRKRKAEVAPRALEGDDDDAPVEIPEDDIEGGEIDAELDEDDDEEEFDESE